MASGAVHKRFIRWAKARVWQNIFQLLTEGEKGKCLMIDLTMIRVYQHAAGAKKAFKTSKKEQAIGKSRGVWITKLHASCTELGKPMRFIVTL